MIELPVHAGTCAQPSLKTRGLTVLGDASLSEWRSSSGREKDFDLDELNDAILFARENPRT